MIYIRTDVLGVGFDNLTMAEALEKALPLMDEKSRAYIVTPNPEIVMLCRSDEKLAQIVQDAAIVLADGIGIIYGAKILGSPMKQKLPGIDFANELFAIMAQRGMSVFLLGAKPEVAKKAAENLQNTHIGLKIAGTNDGYFSEDAPIIEKINAVKPDLLLVCLGAPKQEYWMSENIEKLDVGLMVGLGGSLDVYAGVVERAPEKWQNLGLEWLHRLISDPKRIKRMGNLPKFGFAVIGRRLSGKK